MNTVRSQRRLDVEDFLFHEAELLDNWQLPEWAKLYTDDGHYEITSLNAANPLAADPAQSIFIVADDKERLNLRAERLMKKSAHCEFPHSKTRHLISNVRVSEEGCNLGTKANFVTYRTKGGRTSRYMGEAHYLLEPAPDGFRIKHKRCVLDLDTLHDQGRLTIIL
jgi:p-cumate 2,3-dioxygenase beta subunit